MRSKSPVQLILYFLAIITWWPGSLMAQSIPDSKNVNLAIRRTADRLLRLSGDSASRIGAVDQINPLTWRLQLEHSFMYDSLPSLLQASLDFYKIDQTYDVTVRQCENGLIDLGYQQMDYTRDSLVPCGGRAAPDGCHYLEIVFSGEINKPGPWTGKSLLLLLGLTGGAGLWWWIRRKSNHEMNGSIAQDDGWIEFGHSKLHMQQQILESNGMKQTLTYREAKLLNLFATHPGELLERDFIHQQVWADEGLQVSRSVDVFVSRLRKKLASDTTVSIIAVHGVGYKLEINTAG